MSSRSLLLLLALLICYVCIVSAQDRDHDDDDDEDELSEEGRRRHTVRRQHHKHVHHAKYALPLILAAVVLKLVIVPMVFKSMAVMSIVSVIMSLMSLLVSSLVGYAKATANSKENQPSVKFLHYGLRKRDDLLLGDPLKNALNQQMLQNQLMWQQQAQQAAQTEAFFPKN